MLKLISSLLLTFLGIAGANTVANFNCTESRTGLAAAGTITESNSEAWRFFINITMSNGAKEVIETRYYYGYDVDGSENYIGYSKGSAIDYRETDFRDKKDTITLDIKRE